VPRPPSAALRSAALPFLAAVLLVAAAVLAAPPAAAVDVERVEPVHAIAMHGDPKYGPDFTHFDYANPDAPKGGTAKLYAVGSFDSLHPFIVKGSPPAGIGVTYDTLLTASADEAFTEYGLLAESVEVPEDRSWVIFHLRPEARWHDGEPITAADVVWSFNALREDGDPFYRFYYANVDAVEAIDEHTVYFHFDGDVNMELPLILGQMPIMPKHWWTAEGRDFAATTLDPPLTSGPYRIGDFEPGRFIAYERVEDYWGRDLAVHRGHHNFDVLRYDYYRDTTVALEAFKAGAYDLRVESVAKQWATGYDVPEIDDGTMKKQVFEHDMPSGMQGFAYNMRRPLFWDPKVREALAYAFDFTWSNQNLFYGQYVRTRSYFDNSELASSGLPNDAQLALLEPLRGDIPERVFTEEYVPPSTDGPRGLRGNLRQAAALLQEAGWEIRDGRLVNPTTGGPFAFEILLSSPTWERIALPFVKNLERLGIEATVRTVDSAQYENRMESYDFDMTVAVWGQSLSPGNEQREFWGSAAAEQPGSRNYTGVQSAAIDTLIDHVIRAEDRDALITAVRALDRVLQWNFLVIPHWHFPGTRIAYWDKFGLPPETPMRGVQLFTWWVDADRAAEIGRARASAATPSD